MSLRAGANAGCLLIEFGLRPVLASVFRGRARAAGFCSIDKHRNHEYIRLNAISDKIVPWDISDCFYFI